MPHQRYFHPTSLTINEFTELDPLEMHHLVNVMRTKVGELIELVNGKGELATAKVIAIKKKEVILDIKAVQTSPPANSSLTIVQGFPKKNRLTTILEKGTELGMDEIWIFPADHSENKVISPQQQKKIQSTLIAAMKQCGRLFLPQYKICPPLSKWQSWPKMASFFGDITPNAPLFEKAWKSSPPSFQAAFFVGPESGFSKKEESILKEVGVQGVKLHQNILRTDTAPLVALSLMSHWIAMKWQPKDAKHD